MIKIGLVGIGNRALNFNLPVISSMEDKFSVAGYTSKSGRVNLELEEKTGAKNFSSIDTLAAEVDLLVVSVPAEVSQLPIDQAIETKKPLLLETPLHLDPNIAYAHYQKIKKYGQPVGIIEQWPELPMEQFKKEFVNSELFGNLISVENDYRTYDFHGTAQIRSYLAANEELESVYSHSSVSNSPNYLNFENEMKNGQNDFWRHTIAKSASGVLLINKYTPHFKKMQFRAPKALRLYGTRASVFGGCLLSEDCIIKVLDETGESNELGVNKEYLGNEIKSISTSMGDMKISWENEYCGHNLDEHQIGVARHFTSMYDNLTNNKNIIYDAYDFMVDLMLCYGIKMPSN
jgi:hypothetical protein